TRGLACFDAEQNARQSSAFPGTPRLRPGTTKLFDSARANLRRPTRHTPQLIIQDRRLTIYQPQHSAVRGDKDQRDEKQQQQQACAPFSNERLTPTTPMRDALTKSLKLPILYDGFSLHATPQVTKQPFKIVLADCFI